MRTPLRGTGNALSSGIGNDFNVFAANGELVDTLLPWMYQMPSIQGGSAKLHHYCRGILLGHKLDRTLKQLVRIISVLTVQ